MDQYDRVKILRTLQRSLHGAALRKPEVLVPPAFQYLLEGNKTYVGASGGRMSAKSWSVSRVLLVEGTRHELRTLCCREIQSSLRESAYRLLVDQIRALELEDFYNIRADSIEGRNGTAFFFEGLHHNGQKLKSYEGINRVWVEEAQTVSDISWETLIPTVMRNRGARFYITWNPLTKADPVMVRFVESGRPDVTYRHTTYRDNPYLPPEALNEMEWVKQTDPDAYRHIWEGEPRTTSDALILKGKYKVEAFEVEGSWAGPYHGLDYGYARDPSAAVKCYIDETTRTLYIAKEFWQLGCDIDALPNAMESAIPGISRHVVYADSAQPATTAYIAAHGVPSARNVEKWPNSVDDGIMYLRSFSSIVIHPDCKRFIDEATSYQFKCDRLTGDVLPEAEDKHNHLIDALRYALSPLIRNKPSGGFFSRTALLLNGESLLPNFEQGRVRNIFVAIAMSHHPGSAVAAVTFGASPHYGIPLRVMDWSLAEVDAALLNPNWLASIYERATKLGSEWTVTDPIVRVLAEQGELYEGLREVFAAHLANYTGGGRPRYDLSRIESAKLRSRDTGLPLVSLDERTNEMRATVNGGRYVKLSREAYSHSAPHRTVDDNHLVSQLLGYRPGATDQSQELVAAFAFGCLLQRPSKSSSVAQMLEIVVPAVTETAPQRPRHWLDQFAPQRGGF